MNQATTVKITCEKCGLIPNFPNNQCMDTFCPCKSTSSNSTTAIDLFKKHWKEKTGKDADETTLQHMNYCIDAIQEGMGMGSDSYKNHLTCMGVGDGTGNLFIYGDHESIMAAQNHVIERARLSMENRKLKETLEKYKWDMEDDENSTSSLIFTDDMYNQLIKLEAIELRSKNIKS